MDGGSCAPAKPIHQTYALWDGVRLAALQVFVLQILTEPCGLLASQLPSPLKARVPPATPGMMPISSPLAMSHMHSPAGSETSKRLSRSKAK